jgi:hypothetical protein
MKLKAADFFLDFAAFLHPSLSPTIDSLPLKQEVHNFLEVFLGDTK